MDKKWFMDRLADADKSQRALARALDRDPSSISLMFSGKRKMRMDEAEQIAAFIRQPVEAVLEKAGINLTSTREQRMVPLIGYIDQAMRVHYTDDYQDIQGYLELPNDTVAIRAHTAGTYMDLLDGWVAFYKPQSDVDQALITRLCIVTLHNDEVIIGCLRRGYISGKFNIVTGFEVIENASISKASPVILIQP